MAFGIYNYLQQISDSTYCWLYGYDLNATSENLQWALKQNKEEILKFRFVEELKTYTILEFAIKCGDLAAARQLIELSAPLEYAVAHGTISMLHFYMDSLVENQAPNMEMLSLLLQHSSDIDVKAAFTFQTPLEYALEKMAHFTKIHWDVIDVLLEKGASIEKNSFSTQSPFMVLRDSQSKHSLDHLVEYLTLEKKYHTDSENFLTLQEFKCHTASFSTFFAKVAISMDTSSFSRALIEILSTDSELAEDPESLHNAFVKYHDYFQHLVVKDVAFRDCFTTDQLNSILCAVKQNKAFYAQWLWKSFVSWGLTKQVDSYAV
jgi:hypothetical protein